MTQAWIRLRVGRDSGSLVTHEMGLLILLGEGGQRGECFLLDLTQEVFRVIQTNGFESLQKLCHCSFTNVN